LIMTNEEIVEALLAWAPDLAEGLTALEYLGSDLSLKWFNDSEWTSELELIIRKDGYSAAVRIWEKVLREKIEFPPPVLLLVLEHFRKNPSQAAALLTSIGLSFSRSLANVAHLITKLKLGFTMQQKLWNYESKVFLKTLCRK